VDKGKCLRDTHIHFTLCKQQINFLLEACSHLLRQLNSFPSSRPHLATRIPKSQVRENIVVFLMDYP
jgi:hypothetical protein